jgi:hypothetical protein
MIKVIYSPEGEPVNDFNLEGTFNRILEFGFSEYNFSTENIFAYIKLQVALDVIPLDKFVFVYKGQELHMNTYGKLDVWPTGFCSIVIEISEKLVRTAMTKYKKTKETTNGLHM